MKKIEKLAIPDLESFLALENKREPRVAAVPGANLRSNGARRLARVAELDAGAVARGLPHPCPGRGGARRTEQIWRGGVGLEGSILTCRFSQIHAYYYFDTELFFAQI